MLCNKTVVTDLIPLKTVYLINYNWYYITPIIAFGYHFSYFSTSKENASNMNMIS
jgi:hypothetical protein